MPQQWEASLRIELRSGTHPDDLSAKLRLVTYRLAELDFVQYGTDPEVIQGESSFVKVVVSLEADGDADASSKASRAIESAADAAALPIESARVVEVHRR